ncbi:MAG: CarD family transcriptional regulator [Desulfitibacter sp. BRH_c19]|nr:MAG: CarD family transcriptional regulator [Desulfitibacter sp. BRH_c19]
MFKVGDKVVYPMHGAGIIESIEEREVLGEIRSYYIMKIPIGEMKVMVPMDNVQDIGLRQVINSQEMSEVMGILQDRNSTMNVSWNKRFRANMDKIKSGNIFEVAEVVRNLAIRDKDKGLSTGERKMLESAKRILVSELVLVNDVGEEQVETMIQKVLA